MRTAAVVLTAVLLLLAGCNGGDTGSATPTASPTVEVPGPSPDTPPDDTPTPDGTEETPTATGDDSGEQSPETPTPNESTDGPDDTRPSVASVLSELTRTDLTRDAGRFDVRLFSGTRQTSVSVQNGTDADLLRITFPSGETTAVYTTADYSAVQNATTGETRYGDPDEAVAAGTRRKAAASVTEGLSYYRVVEWQSAGTKSVDGSTRFVYTVETLDRNALNEASLPVDASDVQSVDGKMTVRADGRVRRVSVRFDTPNGTYGSELSVEHGDRTVTRPAWVDTSQAPSASRLASP